MLIIPTTQEAEAGRSKSKPCPGKSARPYLKNKLKKAKGLGTCLKW
jgi:hypothetical protein